MAAVKKLTKADILAVEDRQTKDVRVPEWGGEVTIRALSGAEVEEWRQSQAKTVFDKSGNPVRMMDDRGAMVNLVRRSIIDPATGEVMFNEKEVAGLESKSAGALVKVFTAAVDLNGIRDDAVEEAGKDSETTPSGEPGTD